MVNELVNYTAQTTFSHDSWVQTGYSVALYSLWWVNFFDSNSCTDEQKFGNSRRELVSLILSRPRWFGPPEKETWD